MSVSRDHFYRLASDIEAERIAAAVALINELTAAEDEAEWAYALERLIKGLSSSRGSARLGFSMCLSEIVTIRIAAVKLSIIELVELINKHTKISASMNGKEERSMLFGKLFGLQAISGIIVQVGTNEHVQESDFKLFVDNLIELSCLKSWIREPSLFTIFNILVQQGSNLPKDLIVHIFTKLDENKLSLSIEGLALYLSIPSPLRSTLPAEIHFQNKTWSEYNPLHKSNISLISKVLKDVSIGDDSNSAEDGKDVLKKKGNWSPRLHFVWNVLVTELLKDNEDETVQNGNSKKRSKSDSKKNKKSKKSSSNESESQLISVKEFWKIIIDEQFFSEKASHERKYWGFEIFELLFPKVSAHDTSYLLTNNFLRTLINQSSDNKRLLFKIAKKTLNSIVEVTKTQPSKIKPILKELLVGDHGNLQFDRLTKSKTIELTLKNSTDVTNYEISKFFVSILNKSGNETDEESIKRAKWVIDELLHFVRFNKNSLSSNSDLKWIDLILQSLVLKCYFKQGEVNPIAEFAQERLNSILSDIISIPRTDNQTWSYKTLNFLLTESEDSSSDLKPIFEFDDEISTTLNKTFKILKKIRSFRESSNHLDNSTLLIFELLNSMVLLQLYTGDFTESIEILSELQDYYYDSIKDNVNNSETENDVIGIVEILLNFLSQKSSLLKKISFIVWENYCDKVDLNCLELLFNVITARENKEGQKALFEGEDEFEEEEEEEDGEEEDEDEEEHDHSHGAEHEDESKDEQEEEGDDESSSSSGSDDEDEEEDEGLDEVEKKTNVALAEALKIPYNGEVVLSSDDEDDDDFSDESMDDEQMMEIDGQLAQIFKQRQDALNNVKAKSGNTRKLEKEEAKANIILFKTRVVDLLEIYIKKNPTSELIVLMLLPLLKGLKLTLDKSLGVKIHKLLKNKICKLKTDKVSVIEKDNLLEILETILNKEYILRNSNNNDFNLSCSQCSIFISKKILEIDESSIDQIVDLYSNLLKDWFKKKNSKLPSSIFFDFINWLTSKRSNN
jgi:DNA polymerase phi